MSQFACNCLFNCTCGYGEIPYGQRDVREQRVVSWSVQWSTDSNGQRDEYYIGRDTYGNITARVPWNQVPQEIRNQTLD